MSFFRFCTLGTACYNQTVSTRAQLAHTGPFCQTPMNTLFKACQWVVIPAITLASWATPRTSSAQDFSWTTNNGAISIINYNGPGGEVTIPGTITGLPVRTIASYAFSSRTTVTSVAIPDTVGSVDYSSFANCTSLTNISLGAGLTNIGPGAFQNCASLRGVAIPGSVVTIQGAAFSFCGSLATVSISNGVAVIGASAFAQCLSLTNVTIPDSVTNIGFAAFRWCGGLSMVTIGNGVSFIDEAAFAYCPSLRQVTIGHALTNLSKAAFIDSTNLVAVYFKGDAPTLGTLVFRGASQATAYWLPGTAGWSATLGELPTALWRPTIQTSDSSFGIRTNQFGFNVSWAEGMTIVVETCANLAEPAWFPLHTNTLSADSIYFGDPDWTHHPGRFYRVRWP